MKRIRVCLLVGLASMLALSSVGCGRFKHEVKRGAEGDIVSEKTDYLAFFQKASADAYKSTVKDRNYERTVGVTGAETSGDAEMFLAGREAGRQALNDGLNFAARLGGFPAIPGSGGGSVQWFQPSANPFGVAQPNPLAALPPGQGGTVVTNAAGARFLLLSPAVNNPAPAIGAVGGDGPAVPRGEPPSSPENLDDSAGVTPAGPPPEPPGEQPENGA